MVPKGAETVTEKIQVPLLLPTLAGMVPLVNVIVRVPELVVTVPPQAGKLSVLRVVMGVGRVSVKCTFVIGAVFGLVSVNVRVEVPPAEVVPGLKALAKVTVVGSMMATMKLLTP